MRVFLDEQPCLPDAATIDDAIHGAAALAESCGRVIVEVTVDGEAWDDEQIASQNLREVSANEVALVSTDLGTLVCRTLDDASSALVNADELQRDAAALLQADRRPEGLEKLGAAIDIWRSVHMAVVRSAEAFSLDLQAMQIGAIPLTEAVTRLTGQLDALRCALDGDDPVGLSDALLYDLPEVVAEWREVLHVMRAHVEAAPVAGAGE